MRVAALFFLLALAACNRHATNSTPPQWNQVLVTVIWVDGPAQVAEACPELEGPHIGCAKVNAANHPPRCSIIAPKPAHFDDTAATETLGHELFHCLGARHS